LVRVPWQHNQTDLTRAISGLSSQGTLTEREG
jgi:hypothetical protein